jgi:hypothetical protein
MNTNKFSPAVEDLLDMLSLRFESQYFWLMNKSSRVPYHNAIHVNFMINDLILMARHENITLFDLKLLVETIIFHDFNHTAGISNDSENISRARAAYTNFSTQVGKKTTTTEIILTLINETQYPYVVSEPSTLGKYLRDLDLMTMYHLSNSEETVICMEQMVGLWCEMKISKPCLSWKAFCEGNIKFTQDTEFYTSFGKLRKERCLTGVINIFHNFNRSSFNITNGEPQ